MAIAEDAKLQQPTPGSNQSEPESQNSFFKVKLRKSQNSTFPGYLASPLRSFLRIFGRYHKDDDVATQLDTTDTWS